MKSTKGIKKLLMALALVLCVAAFVPATASVQAEAKTKKVTANKNYKKAPALKLGITYKVTEKVNHSMVKFTAPKNGTYKVTISNIATFPKVKGRTDHNLGNLYIRKPYYNGKYFMSQTVKTQGGRYSCLFTATKDSYNHFYKGRKVKTGTYLASRYGKIKLKKGETIYMDYSYTGKGGKCTYTMKVTK